MSETTRQVQGTVPSAALAPACPSASPALASTVAESRLRMWPGIAIVALLWIVTTLAKIFAAGTMLQFFAMFIGPMIATGLFAAWWLFASRLRWKERWLGLAAFVGTGAIALLLSHATMGPMPMVVFALPMMISACAVWLLVTPFLRWPVRRVGLLVILVLAWGYFTLMRLDGIDGSMHANIAFRWMPTPEDRFLADASDRRRTAPPAETVAGDVLTLEPGDWPGFRGPDRDARVAGVRLVANWDKHPPRQIWRHRVGPGWSSFAVVGQRLYTQEQMGEEEAVICYDAATGRELWIHRDPARFTETMAGPGPRATPTFHEGKIYALGAKGHLNCLDAVTGSVAWTRDIAADSEAKIPIWGFSSSPLVVDDVVTVFAGAPHDKAVLAYSAEAGELLWTSGTGGHSYCSTQLVRFDDVAQLVISTDKGMTAFNPPDGKVLWHFSWPMDEGMSRVVQPALVGASDLLIGTGFGTGTRRVRVTRAGDSWATHDVWPAPSRAIRPYYNDLVVHDGHIYGFDNDFFTCVSLDDGKGKWKARGYGNGQVLLLADQGRLLILSETGEVALVDGRPDGHKQLCRFQAIEGKTWNHPVIAHGKLFVRNGEEAACFELSEEARDDVATSDL